MTSKLTIMSGQGRLPRGVFLQVACLLSLMVPAATRGLAAEADMSSLEAGEGCVLPDQPDVVVLSLTLLPPDSASEVTAPPWMEVFADGRVIVRGEHPGDPTTRGRVTREQLASLLSEMIEEQEIIACDTPQLEQQLQLAGARRGIGAHVEGASTTVLRLTTREVTHEIRCAAVPLLARRFPEVDALQRLAYCRRRMLNLAAIVRAGGESATAALCDAVNRQLAANWPTVQPVTPEDLQVVRFGPGGSRMSQFVVPGRIGSAGETGMVSVAAISSPDRPLRVSVFPGSAADE